MLPHGKYPAGSTRRKGEKADPPPPPTRLHQGRTVPGSAEQACHQHLENSVRYYDHHPILHTSGEFLPKVTQAGGGAALSLALNPVCVPSWPLPAALWVFPPVCGVRGHSLGGRGGRGVAEAQREAHPHTLSPAFPPPRPRACTGTMKISPRPRGSEQLAAEELKGTPGRGTEGPEASRPPCPGQWGLPSGLGLLGTGRGQGTSQLSTALVFLTCSFISPGPHMWPGPKALL